MIRIIRGGGRPTLILSKIRPRIRTVAPTGLGHRDDRVPESCALQSAGRSPAARFLPMTPRRRPLVAILLALALVLMQQGAQLHALDHDNQRLQRPRDAGLQAPVSDGACAMCALFAGGADAAAADAIPPAAPIDHFDPPPRAIALAAVASPSPYQSRAPPPIL
jgi:hypothetical protein